MKFVNDKHKEFVEKCLEKSGKDECYHKALFYVLGLTENCQRNIGSLYDFVTGCVKQVKGAEYGWVTGTDSCIIRLAYNLYNNGAPTATFIDDAEEKRKELMSYLPTAIFGYLDPEMIEYCFEGIRTRYEIR